MTVSMYRSQVSLALCLLLTTCALTLVAQNTTAPEGVVPRLINFSGKVVDVQRKPLPGVAGATFAIYKDQEGGVPLSMETQNVQADKTGRYTVQLGASKSAGLPMELFASGEARWLSVQLSGEAEQPRSLLLSVPYALKALDAETLGARPISSFILAPTSPLAPSSRNKAGVSATPAATPANQIVCSSATACKTGFVPVFATNGGSAKITDAIIKQTGTTLGIAGSESVTGNISAGAVTSTSPSTGITSTITSLAVATRLLP
jgi:hypothetical protein